MRPIPRWLLLFTLGLPVLAAAVSCARNEASRQAAAAAEDEAKQIAANLANFDDLDFNVYSGQK